VDEKREQTPNLLKRITGYKEKVIGYAGKMISEMAHAWKLGLDKFDIV